MKHSASFALTAVAFVSPLAAQTPEAILERHGKRIDDRLTARLNQAKDIVQITRQLGLEASRAIGGISGGELLKLVQQPCAEPHWKCRQHGRGQPRWWVRRRRHGCWEKWRP